VILKKIEKKRCCFVFVGMDRFCNERYDYCRRSGWSVAEGGHWFKMVRAATDAAIFQKGINTEKKQPYRIVDRKAKQGPYARDEKIISKYIWLYCCFTICGGNDNFVFFCRREKGYRNHGANSYKALKTVAKILDTKNKCFARFRCFFDKKEK
jgi:hypothetical protein